MRLVLGAAGAFGGAAAALMGTAVGYGTMLGAAPRPCPHCDGGKGGGVVDRRAVRDGTGVSARGAVVDEAVRREAYDGLADRFDEEIEWHEFLTGIKLMRWWMMRRARGDVLEVAAGTGRNFKYYPPGISSLTATDCSRPMVDVCLAKARRDVGVAADATARADAAASSSTGLPASVSVRVADAANTGFEPRSFDTVVDTFGLCSFEDPVAALREMARVCRSEEVVEDEDERRAASEGGGGGGGRIFLLEHGRSASHAWLSNILDHFAAAHAERWGCYWNRDILALVREAGLEVVEARTFHLGTTHWIVAKPGPGSGPGGPGRRWGKKK